MHCPCQAVWWRREDENFAMQKKQGHMYCAWLLTWVSELLQSGELEPTLLESRRIHHGYTRWSGLS